jgi:hypothetical protein
MGWIERLDRRGRSSRTYQDSADPTRHALDIICGTPLHYESVPDSGVFDAVIDCTPQRVKNAALDGWRITQNGFHYALGKPAGKSDGWVGFGGRQGAHWFSFRLARVGYLHWPTRSWQDIGGNPTYDRANLTSEVNRTAPMADGAELPVSSIARWSNIWQTPGGGALDMSWRVDGARLKEEVIINAAGRAWIAANRKPTTKANETWFGFVFQLDWSDVPRVVRQSVLQSIDGDFADDGLPLELRDAADRLLGFLPVDDLIVRNGEEELGRTPLQKRFWRDGDGNHYLLVGVRCDLLAGMPAGDLVFDPTITLQPSAAAGADTYLYSTYPDSNYGTSSAANVGRWSTTRLYRFLLKFDLSSLPDSAILNSSILTLYQTNTRETPVTIEIFRSKRAWVESQATWNVYATGSSWQEAGGFGANDCDTTVIGSRAFTEPETAGTYRDFVLTPTTKETLDLGNGWLLKAKDEVTADTNRAFGTSDASIAAYRPKLYIEYIVPGAVDDTVHAHAAEAPALTVLGQLVNTDGMHAHASEHLTLAGLAQLVMADGVQAQQASSLTLQTRYFLAPAASTHGLISTTPTLNVQHTLSLADSQHDHWLAALSLSLHYALALSDSAHTQSSDTLLLSALAALELAASTHAQAVEGLALSAWGALQLASVWHDQRADGLQLTSQVAVSIAASQHAHTSTSLVLGQRVQLALLSSLHVQDSTTPQLIATTALSLADSAHAHWLADVIIDSETGLAVADLRHFQRLDTLSLSARGSLSLLGSYHALTSPQLSLTSASPLVVQALHHAQLASQPLLEFVFLLHPQDTRHAQPLASLNLSTLATLSTRSLSHALFTSLVVLYSTTIKASVTLALDSPYLVVLAIDTANTVSLEVD